MTEQANRHKTDIPPSEKILLTVEDVAQMLSLGQTMVYDLLARGELTRIKMGNATRVYRVDVERRANERWVASRIQEDETVITPVRQRVRRI